MNGPRFVNDGSTESASWPLPWLVPCVGPTLILCPVPVAAMAIFPAAAADIYRLAYEQAVAAQYQSSPYELALRVSRN